MGESAIRTITLVNSGNLPLSISSVSVPTGFMCDFSGAIPVGGSNEVTVTFEPAARGPFGGKLTLNCDATSGATNYFISGTGDAGPPVPVTIVEHPGSVEARRGVPVDLNVATAGGQGPITFQWVFNGAALPGATAPTLRFRRIHPRQAGNYFVLVSDGVTSVVSSNATLRVIGLRILKNPRNQSVQAGRSAAFSVSAVGPGPLTYQWFFNDTAIDGATDRKLFLEDVQAENAGTYSVHVSNPTGTLTTPDATLVLR